MIRRFQRAVVVVTTYDDRGKPLLQGSGFFIASDRVVTNSHLIRHASQIRVKTFDGATVTVQTVLAFSDKTDLAKGLIFYFEEPALYLNWTRVRELKLDPERVKRVIRNEARKLKGVSAAFTNSELSVENPQPSAIEASARDLGLRPIDGARTVFAHLKLRADTVESNALDNSPTVKALLAGMTYPSQ